MSNGILGNFSVRNNLVVEEVLINSATSSTLTASGPTLVTIQGAPTEFNITLPALGELILSAPTANTSILPVWVACPYVTSNSTITLTSYTNYPSAPVISSISNGGFLITLPANSSAADATFSVQ